MSTLLELGFSASPKEFFAWMASSVPMSFLINIRFSWFSSTVFNFRSKLFNLSVTFFKLFFCDKNFFRSSSKFLSVFSSLIFKPILYSNPAMPKVRSNVRRRPAMQLRHFRFLFAFFSPLDTDRPISCWKSDWIVHWYRFLTLRFS